MDAFVAFAQPVQAAVAEYLRDPAQLDRSWPSERPGPGQSPTRRWPGSTTGWASSHRHADRAATVWAAFEGAVDMDQPTLSDAATRPTRRRGRTPRPIAPVKLWQRFCRSHGSPTCCGCSSVSASGSAASSRPRSPTSRITVAGPDPGCGVLDRRLRARPASRTSSSGSRTPSPRLFAASGGDLADGREHRHRPGHQRPVRGGHRLAAARPVHRDRLDDQRPGGHSGAVASEVGGRPGGQGDLRQGVGQGSVGAVRTGCRNSAVGRVERRRIGATGVFAGCSGSPTSAGSPRS